MNRYRVKISGYSLGHKRIVIYLIGSMLLLLLVSCGSKGALYVMDEKDTDKHANITPYKAPVADATQNTGDASPTIANLTIAASPSAAASIAPTR